MSVVNVTHVGVLDNPSRFSNPLQFEIQYECLFNLQEDLEWKLTYVGSAENEKYDQVLDSVLVGPVVAGSYRFVFQANPPDASRIPASDMLGVTVLLLTCSYRDQEFIRVGYYVNNEYDSEELRESPPETVQVDRLMRNILADKPRVTKFLCEFDSNLNIPSSSQAVVDPALQLQVGGELSMDGSLAGDMIDNGMQQCAAMMNGAAPSAPPAVDIMMEG
mmetsp:Transcript_11655/g.15846  ORF Transcript_11655/g.15846 Transcript_11655/m.15846 type:complete len:219 (-) Transcript_11655:119-775(-)|eukprot:CAMPEP_0196578674 /NCGR_PEP_ID=MMETSP1081-20130531/7532_1 /TAXON_ID=36882 /ORGANISM="Pyramimonas amylifera, Strain CCMP720" /LENGTH=218 /DNA_ID=CAMNT_0041897957 /DNA_START=430 /DNA_END=1086 /DNA_ORIENTATION=-